eukprot:jgi/Tetstr1/461578/TSEL_006679.t1
MVGMPAATEELAAKEAALAEKAAALAQLVGESAKVRQTASRQESELAEKDIGGGAQRVMGDQAAWDAVFASGAAEEVVRTPGPAWFEGPQEWSGVILYSDTVNDRINRYDKHSGSSVFRRSSGGAAAADLSWMAEPGANGIVIDHTRPDTAYICQHGAHAVSRLNLQTGEITPLATHFRGIRLNGPNDIVLDAAGQNLYFTDPVYAYLEQKRFYDAAYLDDECDKNLGVKGVYRLPVNGTEANLQLLDGLRLQRPNGLALSPDGERLFVGECCQGDHLKACQQGTVRYHAYELRPGGGGAEHLAEVSFRLEGPSAQAGCADGFKVHPATGLLVGSCASGICVVRVDPASLSGADPAPAARATDAAGGGDDMEKTQAARDPALGGRHEAGKQLGLLARLELSERHPVSNVLLASDGFLYATAQDSSGDGVLLRIPLQRRHDGSHDELR